LKKVRWTRPALIDLNEAIAYIAHDNPKAALSVAARIAESIQNLAQHPWLGRPGRVPGTRKLVIAETPYIVPYRILGDGVDVLRVLHAARRWPTKF
jgi:toxin ParE1/3/4